MPVIVPGRGDVHVNTMLTGISIGFAQDQKGFVADRTSQGIPVTKSANSILELEREAFMRNQMRPRAPGTESTSITYKQNHDRVYVCVPSSLSVYIADQIRADADDPVDLDAQATELLTQQALIERDVAFASQWMKTGVWTGEAAGVAAGAGSGGGGAPGAGQFLQWNDPDSTPIETIRAAITARAKTTGRRMNILTIGREVYDALVDHPDIVARVNQGQTPGGPAMVDAARLAEIFELDEVNVMDAVVDSALEEAAAAIDYIGGKKALLTYRPSRPGILTPAALYTFNWRGERMQNGPQGWSIEKWYERGRKADKVEINQAFDQFQMEPDLGYVFLTAVA